MKDTFQISLTTTAYKTKPVAKEVSKLRFQQKCLTVSELSDAISDGYCFCPCFNTLKPEFGMSEKCDANFDSSQWVWLDVDDGMLEMNNLVSTIHHKPTLYYTTPNNNVNRPYKYRLGYMFNEAITSVSDYHKMYDGIMGSITASVPDFKMKDNCGRSPSQYMNGNGSGNCEIYPTDKIYNFEDFSAWVVNEIVTVNPSRGVTTSRPRTDINITDNHFMRDLDAMKSKDLILKYRNIYPFFTRTELRYQDGFALIPSDYQEIHRKWYRETCTKENGDEYTTTVVKKLNDGDHRRRNLFIGGLIRKLIKPDITFEHLLFNLVCEREWYCYNMDGVLTNNVLVEIAQNVTNTPLEDIHLRSRNKRRFEVDKTYCTEHGITPKQMKSIVTRRLKDEEIGEMYDCSISVADNLKNLKAHGVKVSRARLYEFCKENNISTRTYIRRKTE